MKKFYFHSETDNDKTLVIAAPKSYFDAHGRIDAAGTDGHADFHQAITAQGFSEIFPPVYQKTGDNNMISLLDAMARAGFSLCESAEFTKAAKRLIIEGPQP